MYIALSLTCKIDSILDISDPEKWVEMKLLVDQQSLSLGFFIRHMWIITAKNKYISCGLTPVHVCHMLWGFSLFVLLSLPAADLAYLFVSVLIYFIINSGKKIEKNQMVWSCHPLLQLNHSVQKTEAKKVADLRMTTLMQNWKFHSGSYVSSCLTGLRMVIQNY